MTRSSKRMCDTQGGRRGRIHSIGCRRSQLNRRIAYLRNSVSSAAGYDTERERARAPHLRALRMRPTGNSQPGRAVGTSNPDGATARQAGRTTSGTRTPRAHLALLQLHAREEGDIHSASGLVDVQLGQQAAHLIHPPSSSRAARGYKATAARRILHTAAAPPPPPARTVSKRARTLALQTLALQTTISRIAYHPLLPGVHYIFVEFEDTG